MPSYISNKGKWYAAKEKVGLINKGDTVIEYNGKEIQPGEPFIYEGGDREALNEIGKNGGDHLGRSFENDPDFLKLVRDMGYKDSEEYLKSIGYDAEKEQQDFEDRAVKVEAHEVPKKVKMIKALGGGKDFAGAGKDNYGEFDSPPELG